MESILNRSSKAVLSAINGTDARRKFIPYLLGDLIKLETRPECLTRMAYEWCSVICENRQSLEDRESLLLLCLEIGFRHLDFQRRSIKATITHTEHHRGLVDVVFESQESEVIADLLHAWTAESKSHEQAHTLLGFCAGHLVSLHNLVSFSPRLRRLVIRSVELIGYKGFEVGVERFIELLDHLHVTAEDIEDGHELPWVKLLMETLQSFKGAQHLPDSYWELLVELAILTPSWISRDDINIIYNPQTMTFLTEAKEWSKLECWTGTVWMLLPREADAMAGGDLGRSMLLLFCQRPGALQKLERWMERWGQENNEEIPESFEQICKQAHEAAQRDAP